MLTFLAVLAFAICAPLAAAVEVPGDYSGYWSFSDEWAGYMGSALEIKGETFRYWSYSDVVTGNEPKQPVIGNVEIINGVMNLITDRVIYSKKWILVQSNNQEFGIFPLDNIAVIHIRNEKASTRMMSRVSKDNEPDGWPIMNAPIPTLAK